jgi:predicted transcriptional regulator
VRLYAYRGRIEILTEAIYEERKREAAQTAADDVGKLEAAGLN